jgi:hypothetical protein
MEHKRPMSSPAIALEAKQRCPGCLSHAEQDAGGICTTCEQKKAACRLVVQLSDACETTREVYAIKPHPLWGELLVEIVQISRKINKAAGIE